MFVLILFNRSETPSGSLKVLFGFHIYDYDQFRSSGLLMSLLFSLLLIISG